MKEQVRRNFIYRLLKKDLKDLHKVDYGMECMITNDILNFYGIAKRNLEGKNLVVQIAANRNRILKEIWIHGTHGTPQSITEETFSESFTKCWII